jgi:hypothetical protein
VIFPTLFQKQIIGGYSWMTVSGIIIVLALVWLCIFIVLDLRDILKASGKFNEDFPFKNLFVIFVIGYIMFENAIVEPNILRDSKLIFGLFLYSMSLCFAMIIGELLLKYASNEKFQQISVNTLGFTAFLSLLYAMCAFGNFSNDIERKVGIAAAVLLTVG